MDGPCGSACAVGVDRWRLSRCVLGPAFWYGMDGWSMGRRGPSVAAKSLARAGSRCRLLSGLAGKLWFEPRPMGLGRICDPQRANGADCRRWESHDLIRSRRADRCARAMPASPCSRVVASGSRDPERYRRSAQWIHSRHRALTHIAGRSTDLLWWPGVRE